jgi:inorganic triphosphatase YgiF
VAAAGGLEIEAKLSASDPEGLERQLRAESPPPLAGFEADGPPRLVTMVDRYVDTALVGGWLRSLGMRARLREAEGEIVLTVKRQGSQAGSVMSRPELEGPATTGLDPHAWPDSAARAALFEAIGTDPLLEIARLRQHRLYRIWRRDDTVVELSLDALEAMDGDEVLDRRHEIEAELVEGDPAGVHALAGALSRLPGVGPALGSKLQFALDAALRGGAAARMPR